MAKFDFYNDEEFEDDYTASLLGNISQDAQDEIDFKMKLAAKIIYAMKDKGIDKTAFAKAMGVKNPSIITKWLSGTNNFEISTLRKISKVLNIRLIDTDLDANTTTAPISTSLTRLTTIELAWGNYEDFIPANALFTVGTPN
jgi:transcriptional regulator with XRE-family HTH domain